MRKLIILRGAPGTGKTTFIKKQGLKPYSISPDDIRISIGGIIMDPLGRITINQTLDREVWYQLEKILNHKMKRGEFIILDATFQSSKDFKMPMQLASQHNYDIQCIDFSDINLDTAIHRNKKRPIYKQVPEPIVKRAYERINSSKLPQNLKITKSQEYQNKFLLDEIDIKLCNLNSYKKIHHIGDLQGCYTPVEKYLSNGVQNDEFYIFIGDFLDRGIQNGEVIRWIVNEMMDRPNVLMIWGNHESHIQYFATNQPPVSTEFEYETLPQLEKVGFTKQQAYKLCNKLHDCFIYEYDDIRCLVTHAGIAKVPENPILIPSIQYWKGTGTYQYPVDETFSHNMKNTNWIQIHGHRNAKNLPIQAAEKSYNLEGKVEFGGHLRILTLEKGGNIKSFEIKNEIYRKTTEKPHKTNNNSTNQNQKKIPQDTLSSLLNHKLISRKSFKSYPHIHSYNFTQKAFFKKQWDNINITARGLFIDDHRNIVARSYGKFFNLNEIEETKLNTLSNNLVFPITLYIKENGFLGILGYDEITNNLFFASKSTPESTFANWFKEIFTVQVGKHQLNSLANILHDKNLSMVFEVIDPIRDPHIIKYNKQHIILLDIIYRTKDFKRIDFNETKEIAKNYNIPFKKRAVTFKDWESFNDWYKHVENEGMNYTFKGKHIEGFVIEDSKNFMFKIKLPYYCFWRHMRSLKDRILFIREKGGELNRNITIPLAQTFYKWAKKQPNEVLQKNIITLKEIFEQNKL